MGDDLAAVAAALKHAREELSRVRSAGSASSADDAEAYEALASEAEMLRSLLERRPLEGGCDPVHDEPAPPAEAVAAPPPEDAEASLELLARIEALDAQYDGVLEGLEGTILPEPLPAPLPGPDGPDERRPGPPRIFALGTEGLDVRGWQRFVNTRLDAWRIEYEIGVDGIYGDDTAVWSQRIAFGLGLAVAPGQGLTPEVRIKARHPELRTAEEVTDARARRPWLRRLRRRYNTGRLHTPIERILTSSHGFKAGHDGIDLICPADATIFAVCRAVVIDVRTGGWWGKSPTGNVALGDGIIQLRALESIGPLKAGMHIGYGHAEQPRVRVGQTVRAGDVLGRAGFANAWHIHFMLNDGGPSIGTRGIGTMDPRPCLDLFTRRR